MYALILLITCLLGPIPSHATIENGGEVWGWLMPRDRVLERFNQVRKILLPVPEQQLEEALYHIGSYYIPIDSETDICRNHSNYFFESFLKKDFWALTMIDASSKIPAGILDGRMMDLGSYDECIRAEEPEGRFRGQYCLVETEGILPRDLTARLNPESPFLETIRSDLAFAVCVPSSCTARDVKVHMDVALNSVNASAIIHPHSCSTSVPLPYTAAEVVSIFIIIVLLVMIVLSTIYDSRCKESDRNGLLAAWSLGANIGQMVNTSTTTAAITCLNGLRVIAMLWVIIGHRTLHLLSFPSLRYRAIPEMIDVLEMAPIENTQLSVEIFFLMSGVLVAYGLFRYLDKGKKFNLVQFYVYRYLRLTPTLAALVLLQATILRRATDGPLWRRMFYDYQHNCQTNWWSTLLYIANYVNPVSMAWYLCADFQLYVLSPLVLLPLWRRPRVGLTITAVLATLTTVAALINAYTEELKAGGAVTLDRRTEVNNTKDYIITHLRAFSFLLGLALGYLLFLIKKGKIIIKLPTWKLWVGWVVSVFFILFSIFFVNYFLAPSYVYNPIVDTVYHILHRHLLALGFSWIILVCTLGYGGFVDKFLSWRGWIPMARLTYCAYLTHVFIQNSQTNSMRTTTSLHSTYVIYFLFAADTVISFLSAAALYLMVEAPVANITSYFFEGNKKPKNSEDTSNNAPTLPVFKYKSSS